MNPPVVLDGSVVVTMNARRSEHATGHVVEGERISAVAAGPGPGDLPGARYVHATTRMATQGLVKLADIGAPPAAGAATGAGAAACDRARTDRGRQ